MGRHAARLRWVVALVAATVAVLATVDRLRDQEREREQGGGTVQVTAEALLPAASEVADLTAAHGWREGANITGDPQNQSVLLRLSWSGPRQEGTYQLILLDTRTTPARVIRPHSGWDAAGSTGFNWADEYETLAQRYDWLAGTAARPWSSDSLTTPDNLGAIGTRATTAGSLVALFRMGLGAEPLTDPAHLVVAFCHVDADGKVRWAKRVPVTPGA
ncbi:hypothetical protein E0H26_10715 [Micromonospora zingiberis]|uniref:Uncharacterized protein n=1 Tax=Micromonospora zingiberis TaxID=2053011 RepID=A0A4R0GRC1_9ACTN|nr:hypothetical protein [Micromonospora zingiberis]TCB98048.1 hypothetical protein E0H26_10715 [Micromonospora zingiberis]